MQIPSNIFKSYDIRGIYPTEINDENIAQIITAIYVFFKQRINKDNFTVVLGNDMRLSSPALMDVARQTLQDLGANVIDVGILSTPTFYFAVWNGSCDAGIQITASHNPKDYNGVKFVIRGENGLIKIGKPTGMEEVKQMALDGIQLPKSGNGTVTKKEGVVTGEVKNALDLLHNPKLKKFKIVADPANAMGIAYLEAMEKVVPMELIKMNFTLDGTFPAHQPDPLNFENLKDLQKKVLEEKADFGLAPDGDGDRMFFIDEKGQVIPATIITSIIAKELLKDNPGAEILVDIRYLLTPKKIIEENGGKMDITRVGHAFITEAMNKSGAIFAGESSAHYFYKATGNAESQLITVLTVMKVLTEENCALSELVQKMKRSFESGEINFKVENAQEIMEAIKKKYEDGEITAVDCVEISYPTWRFSIRTSNTEPLLRLNVESYDANTMQEKRDELVKLIESLKNNCNNK